jgi:hypothetical protein
MQIARKGASPKPINQASRRKADRAIAEALLAPSKDGYASNAIKSPVEVLGVIHGSLLQDHSLASNVGTLFAAAVDDGIRTHHGGLSHSASFVFGVRPRWFFTAIARAFFRPTSTTSC